MSKKRRTTYRDRYFFDGEEVMHLAYTDTLEVLCLGGRPERRGQRYTPDEEKTLYPTCKKCLEVRSQERDCTRPHR